MGSGSTLAAGKETRASGSRGRALSHQRLRSIPALALLAALAHPAPATAEPSERTRRFIAHDAPLIAIENVTVIDGTGTDPQPDRTVLIRDGRIEAVGAANEQEMPPDAERIDGRGKTLIPGLVMVHEHLIYPALDLGYNHQAHSFPPCTSPGARRRSAPAAAPSRTAE